VVFKLLVTTSCQSRGLERGIPGRIRKTKNKDLYKRVITKKNLKRKREKGKRVLNEQNRHGLLGSASFAATPA
jgi:hypothetical protein